MGRLIVLLLLVLLPVGAAARVVSSDETWSGKVIVDAGVTVAPEATLTIKPGTELLFGKDAALQVEGFLVAKGTAEATISFGPLDKAAGWPGIAILSGPRPAQAAWVKVLGAATGFTVQGSKLVLSDSLIQDGSRGILAGAGSFIEVRKTVFTRLSIGAVDANAGTLGVVADSRMERAGDFGVMTGKKVSLSITGNLISGVKVGVGVGGGSLPVESNTFTDCEVGIGVSQTDPGTVLKGNRFNGCRKGVACLQFASPEVNGNVFNGCDVGIDCFQASSPYVTKNRFTANKRALVCVQMCNPALFRNEFTDNEVAVYLHLSSYAVIHENNFDRNKISVELDNMSYDWEVRAAVKPPRFRQAQNDALVKLGRAVPEKFKDEVKSEGFVNAKENYWGEAATKEMEAKGKDADISVFKDYFDVPLRRYEGWEGEYKQDKVNYEGWRRMRISEAGP